LKEVWTLIRSTYKNKFKNIRYNNKSNNNLISRDKLKSIRIVMVYGKLDRKKTWRQFESIWNCSKSYFQNSFLLKNIFK